jgi:hypothetical protein
MRNKYLLISKPEWITPFGRPSYQWEGNVTRISGKNHLHSFDTIWTIENKKLRGGYTHTFLQL